jgi:MFS family permease
MESRRGAGFALAVLFAINLMNFYDRAILGAVGEDIKSEWELSDSSLGLLGTAFILLYAVVGVPLGRFADRSNRTRILTVGVFFWSLLTAASGLAQNFFQMVGIRLAVGVGEATCAPASTSLIGDYFPASKRARAIGIFMLGLPLGNAACYTLSGLISKQYNWQAAFYVAIIPGLICAALAFMIPEPKRGGSETHSIGAKRRPGNPYWLVLTTPTVMWIIASGALHNFNMYAIGGFLSPFLQRFHHCDKVTAGYIVSFVYGLVGVAGLFLGGFLGDRLYRKRVNGRMLVAAAALAISVPLLYYALKQPAGEGGPGKLLGLINVTWSDQAILFTVLFGVGCGLMYVYYSTVYSTVQDVIEPSLRGTAMALYFCAMYALGGALGPYGFGIISDLCTKAQARTAGVELAGLSAKETFEALKPFMADGIHDAMFVIPAVNLVLAVVLFAGSRTVKRDAERLQKWMRESSEETPPKPMPVAQRA